MLPLPFKNFLWKIFGDNPTPASTAMAAKADGAKVNGSWNHAAITGWAEEVKALGRANDVIRTPPQFLDELGYGLGADLASGDSTDTKRKKIFNAMSVQKHRGLWAEDVKFKIDSITGASASIFNALNVSDWILFGGLESGILPNSYMGILGTDGIDLNAGFDLVGAGMEPDVAGMIQIDVGTSTLTSDQVLQVVNAIKDTDFPCYFRGYLGYTSAGAFTGYANGQIG